MQQYMVTTYAVWCKAVHVNVPQLTINVYTAVLCWLQAIKEGRNRFNFLGQDIRLIPSCAICVTMNPGYAGE